MENFHKIIKPNLKIRFIHNILILLNVIFVKTKATKSPLGGRNKGKGPRAMEGPPRKIHRQPAHKTDTKRLETFEEVCKMHQLST